MPNTIITKNSATASAVPSAASLVQGELAVNVTDKKLYTKNASGTVVEIGGGGAAQVGDIVVSNTAPTTGTWLETDNYYSKASYPALAAYLGDVPDFRGVNSTDTKMNGLGFAGATSSFNQFARYLIATNPSGTIGVMGFTNGYMAASTDSGATWRPINQRVGGSAAEIRWLNNQFVALSSSQGQIVTSTDGVTWTYRNAVPGGLGYSIAYGAGRYVVVGSGVTSIVSTTDFGTWTTVTVPAGMNRVIYANGIFVAVGSSTFLIYSSTDGVTWTQRSSSGSGSYYDVIYEGGRFVAVGDGASYQSSTDGITWTARGIMTGSPSFTLNQVAYSSSLGLYVAVGTVGYILTSPDAATWTVRMDTTTSPLGSGVNASVVWDGTYFYVGTYNSSNTSSGYYYRSSNGTTWTTFKHVSVSPFFNAGVACGKTYLAGEGAIDVSTAGTPWVLRRPWGGTYRNETTTVPRQVAYGNGRYVVAAGFGPFVSSDLINWTAPIIPSIWNPLFSCAYFLNGNFLVFGGSNTVRLNPTSTTSGAGVCYSSDGVTWNSSYVGTNILSAAAYGAGLYVVVGQSGGIYTSPDLVTWTARLTGSASYQDVIYANGIFVAVGSTGGCATSTDGITWTNRAGSVGSTNLSRIIFANSLFVTVTAGGGAYTSPDGITWTARTVPVSSQALYDVAWSSTLGLFCTAGGSGAIATSPDGITWTSRTTSANGTFAVVKWIGSRFVLISNYAGQTITSTNGVNWSMDCSAISLSGMLSDANGIVFGLHNNYLQTTTDGVNWQMIPPSTPGVFGNNTQVTTLNNRHFVLCSSGQVLTSTDGFNFTGIPNIGTLVPNAVAYGNGMWLVTVMSSFYPLTVYKSTDGVTWTKASQFGTTTLSSVSISNMNDLVFSNGKFVIFFQSTTTNQNPSFIAYSSTDGVTWTPVLQTPQTFANQRVAASPTSDAILAITTSFFTGARVSRDWGTTWDTMVTTTNTACVFVDGCYLYDYYYSIDNCQTFSNIVFGLPTISPGIASAGAGKLGDYVFTINSSSPQTRIVFNVKSGFGWQVVVPPALVTTGVVQQAKPFMYRSADQTFFGAGQQIASNLTQGIIGYPAYGYDKTTTFFVPPSAGNVGFKSYICASPT